MALQPGTKAPDFELRTQANEPLRLSEKLGRGPVVLAFFPMAFTGVCTTEMCEFQDSMADFATVGAEAFGISGDSPFSLKAFAEKNDISFTLLSDYNHEAVKLYDVEFPDFLGMKGVAKRSVFVLDKEGVIRYTWVNDNPGVKPDIEEIRKAVKETEG